MSNLRAFYLVVGLSLTFGAHAASFDCKKATSVQETLICADPALSALDTRIAGLYTFAQDILGHSSSLRNGQRNWIARERAACTDVGCLKSAYDKRSSDLFAILDKNTRPFGPSVKVGVTYPAAPASNYCKLNHAGPKDPSGQLSIELTVRDSQVPGTIEGIIDCGRKIVGPIDVKGELIGHVAVISFNGGHAEDDGSLALTAVTEKGVYWRVFDRRDVEGYVPRSHFFNREKEP